MLSVKDIKASKTGIKFGVFDREKIFSAMTIMQFDEYYSSKRAGYSDVFQYFADSSCCHVIDKVNISV